MKTGFFYHPVFLRRAWSIIGRKFAGFHKVIEEISKIPEVQIYEIKEPPMELLLEVHTRELLERVRGDPNYHLGLYAAGGCIEAGEKVLAGEIANAFLLVAGCHHAGRDFAWGGCTISGAGPMILNLRRKFGKVRVAILDTDSHHGDGTRALFLGDRDVLHVCFCSMNRTEDGGTKVDVDVGWRSSDDEYLEKVREHFIPKAEDFTPDLIYHILGHDTARGDYGDRGLSPEFYPKLVREIKDLARRICSGRYIVGLGGGARADLAEYITLRAVRILAEITS